MLPAAHYLVSNLSPGTMNKLPAIFLILVTPDLLANPNLAGPGIDGEALLFIVAVLVIFSIGPIALALFAYRRVSNSDMSRRRALVFQLPCLLIGVLFLLQLIFPPYGPLKTLLLAFGTVLYLGVSALVYRTSGQSRDMV